jgi:hypothetical protein
VIITDAAINIFPTLEDKVHIVQNAIDLAPCAGQSSSRRWRSCRPWRRSTPRCQSTIEAAALCKMADRGQITGGLLDGPLALDNAIDLGAAQIKKIDSPVAGRADILVVPDLEAGNMLAKSLSFMADADAAGIVLGARVPIILTSRADSVMTRLASCAVAALVAQARREEREARRWPDERRDPGAQRRLVQPQVFAVPERGDELELRCADRSRLYTAPPLQCQGRGGVVLGEQHVGGGRSGSATTAPRPSGDLPARADSASTGWPPSDTAWCTAAWTTRAGPLDAPSWTTWSVHPAGAAAPAAQPRADPRAAGTPAALPQVACFDTAFHRTQPEVAQAFALPREITDSACAATASTAFPTSTSPPSCRLDPRGGAGAPWCCTWATAPACARSTPAAASPAPWASPPSTACRWAPAAAASTPASCCT